MSMWLRSCVESFWEEVGPIRVYLIFYGLSERTGSFFGLPDETGTGCPLTIR